MGEFLRQDFSANGKSSVEIQEVDLSKDEIVKVVFGKRVILHPLKVSTPTKCYVVIEKLLDHKVALIDLIYGNIDLNTFERNPNIRNKILTKLSRENIDGFTRHYMGGLSEDVARQLASIVKKTAFGEMRTVTTEVNNMFSNKTSLFENFKKFATRNVKPRPSSETGVDMNGENQSTSPKFTTGEGILFYPSGAAIIEEKVCTKFTYCTKDIETKQFIKLDSFLVSGVDINRMEVDDLYRKRFVFQVCTPTRLKNTRGKAFPYIGSFNRNMVFENDFDITCKVNELREQEGRSE